MEQRFQEGTKAVLDRTAAFVSGELGAILEPGQVLAHMDSASGDGYVTGKVKLTVNVEIDLASHPFPFGPGVDTGTIEAG